MPAYNNPLYFWQRCEKAYKCMSCDWRWHY